MTPILDYFIFPVQDDGSPARRHKQDAFPPVFSWRADGTIWAGVDVYNASGHDDGEFCDKLPSKADMPERAYVATVKVDTRGGSKKRFIYEIMDGIDAAIAKYEGHTQ